LILLAFVFILCGLLLQYKVKGRSEKAWVNMLVGIGSYIFVIVGIILASVAFAGGFDASQL
jgi:hypothetical protein